MCVYVCVRLIVYLQSLALALFIEEGSRSTQSSPPSNASLAPVSGNTPEPWPLYVSILSNGKHTHINLILFPQLSLMTAIKETDDQHDTQLIN